MNKLVIIDDDPIDHFLMQHMLQDNSFFDSTTYTMDGALLLDYMEENKLNKDALPDVIFLDLNMPHFSGWDFLDRLQALYPSLNKKTKVHILTSSIRPVDKERSTKYPFIQSYINKPLNEDIINHIKSNP